MNKVSKAIESHYSSDRKPAVDPRFGVPDQHGFTIDIPRMYKLTQEYGQNPRKWPAEVKEELDEIREKLRLLRGDDDYLFKTEKECQKFIDKAVKNGLVEEGEAEPQETMRIPFF